MIKAKALSVRLREWLRPFHHPRLSYNVYLRVRWYWWLRFGLSALFPALFGYLLTVGALAMATLGIEYGSAHISGAEVIGWYAAKICQIRGACSAETLQGVSAAVVITASGMGSLVWFFCHPWRLKPPEISENEVQAFRQYLQLEELKHGLYECGNDRDRAPGLGASLWQSGQLDPDSPLDRGTQAAGAGDRESEESGQY